ncbi:MAG: hypothetical protein GY820_14185 [Gammaproteobacteria bacterium]|nr:hypothetical protein [Gammaproteobacteria bacterium]
MKSSIEDFKTGWYGVKLRLGAEDIDSLIDYLQMLKDDETYHFHIFSNGAESETSGIADIEISRKAGTEDSNMYIGA